MADANRIAIMLDETELLELQRVLIDDDAAGALRFLRQCLAPRLPRKGTALCDSTRLNPFLLRETAPHEKETF
ncbi:MAG: hypothetical protein ACYDCO_17800 [Armatimonadota bacterium]